MKKKFNLNLNESQYSNLFKYFSKKLNWEKRIKLKFVKLIQINPILMLLIFSGN